MPKKNYPKITIITPSYNQGSFIKETIDSVLKQNYPNLELLIIDGGSTDNTIQILKSYGKKINWVSEKDKGQTHAINKALKKATGEIIAYLNSDDVYLPGTLQTIADFFTTNPEAEWVSGNYKIIDQNGKEIQKFTTLYKTFLRKFPFFSTLAVANFIIQPSTFLRKKLITEIGTFDQRLRYCMDYDYWLRCIQKHRLFTLDQPLSLFRIHSTSKGGSQYQKQFIEEHFVLERYSDNLLILLMHKLHASVIVMAYKRIK